VLTRQGRKGNAALIASATHNDFSQELSPMNNLPLHKDEILDSKEIAFTNRHEFNFPQLMRLTLDFELCVLQLDRNSYSHITKRQLPNQPLFVLTERNYFSNNATYSPRCNSLEDLETYARAYHVDILHQHLFGELSLENNY
jgi:hypothetical protein